MLSTRFADTVLVKHPASLVVEPVGAGQAGRYSLACNLGKHRRINT
jgi:hypothetical protein